MRSIAIHEAGHAVAGMALGMRIMYICTSERICMPFECDAAPGSYQDMLFSAAGYVAEELFCGADAMYELEFEAGNAYAMPSLAGSDGVRFFAAAEALRKTRPAQQRLMLRALAEVRALLQAHAGDVETIARQALGSGAVELHDYKLAQ
ncbi:hypothetical protein [Azonexus hydrophilus]|uniref:Peptidase M41 domain-containing protein n=1 Tax=Azonexus hydrophilus TaxID=418702 RepID=A0ABZ2XC70_9RHOO